VCDVVDYVFSRIRSGRGRDKTLEGRDESGRRRRGRAREQTNEGREMDKCNIEKIRTRHRDAELGTTTSAYRCHHRRYCMTKNEAIGEK
jgi:hypothetical protein